MFFWPKKKTKKKEMYRSYLNGFLSMAIDLNDSNRMGTINKIDNDEMVLPQN